MPLLRLGGVALPRSCEFAIAPKLHQCHIDYVETVRKQYVDAKCYDGSESVKRVMCCALWTAKQYMIDASRSTSECSVNVTSLYSELPTNDERDHLLDQCSEYGEGVAACDPIDPLNRSGTFLGTFIITLFVFLFVLPALIFGGIKLHELYQDHK